MNDLITKISEIIYTIRGQRVMLDRDLAALYGVETKALNQAVKRNIERFPSDFMFQLTDDEWNVLRSQIVTANINVSKIRTLPFAFTEHGVTMLSSVLKSKKAIEINIQVVRAFIQLRKFAISQNNNAQELENLKKMLLLHIENTDNKLKEHDKSINTIIQVLNNLIEQPREHKKIGF